MHAFPTARWLAAGALIIFAMVTGGLSLRRDYLRIAGRAEAFAATNWPAVADSWLGLKGVQHRVYENAPGFGVATTTTCVPRDDRHRCTVAANNAGIPRLYLVDCDATGCTLVPQQESW